MLLIGILGGYLAILTGLLYLLHSRVFIAEEPTEVFVEEIPDVWAGIDEARRRHPLPEARTDLEALEVAGPVYVRRPEYVGVVGRSV